jgi:hypothetical protein
MRRSILGLFLACVAAASFAEADTAMLSFNDPGTGDPAARGSDGFRFTPNVDIEVSALGYYDYKQDGFPTSQHPVALYDFATKERLVRVVVNTASTLDGIFRYTAIEPLRLSAGQSYVIAGYTPPLGANAAELPLEQVTIDSRITFHEYRYFIDGADVTFPNEVWSELFFGPNLLFHTFVDAAPGDTNEDGAVDIQDLNNVRNNFGAAGNPVLGDTAPFDGVVGIDDLNAVRNNFGAGPGNPVPEPSSVGLMCGCGLASLVLLARRRAMP